MIVEKEMNNVDKKQNKEFLDFIYYFIEKIIKYYNNDVFVKKYYMDSRYYQINNYDHLLISKYIDRCQISNVDDLEYEFKKFKDNLLISTDNKKRYFKFNH